MVFPCRRDTNIVLLVHRGTKFCTVGSSLCNLFNVPLLVSRIFGVVSRFLENLKCCCCKAHSARFFCVSRSQGVCVMWVIQSGIIPIVTRPVLPVCVQYQLQQYSDVHFLPVCATIPTAIACDSTQILRPVRQVY